MWLKFAQDNLDDDIPGLAGKPWRDIGEDELIEDEKYFSWMKQYYNPDGTEIPHDSKYHQESLIDHIRMVPQAIKNLQQYKDNPMIADIIGIAGVFHDHWKIDSRRPKTRYECTQCGNLSENPKTPCSKCEGKKSSEPIQVMGYHGHEADGAKDENLFPRLQEIGIPEKYWKQIQLMIRHHLTMHDILETIEKNKEITEPIIKKWRNIFLTETGFGLKDKIKMAVILAIGDDLGRRSDDAVRTQNVFYNQNIENITRIIDNIVSKIYEEVQKEPKIPTQRKNDQVIDVDKLKNVESLLTSNGIDITNLPNTKNSLMAYLSSINRKDLIQGILNIIK